jgi:mannose-6-phosphate isomerase
MGATDLERRPAPIKLAATLHETIWGGRDLADVAGKRLPAGARVGESWETEVGNVAVAPPYDGRTLAQLVEELGEALVGARALEVFGPRFPLLAKFLDARDKLSVQVHPADAYAREHEAGKLGKTEAWYILRAEPGAQLVYGLERPATVDEVRRAIAETRLEALLHYVTVRPGDVVFVPAGTVHAIGAGIVLYELQEYSDVTYRLYDYGRLQDDGTPRQLHVAQGLAVMRFDRPAADTAVPAAAPELAPGVARRVLVACQYFVLEELRAGGRWLAATRPTSCEIISVLQGSCQLVPDGGRPLDLGLGETAVLPASLGAYEVRGDDVRFLRSYVPTPDDAAWALWRAAQPRADAGGGAR